MNRRDIFKFLAGAAALPIVAKLPAPLRRPIEQAGAWFTCQVKAGQITSISIINAGSVYMSSPFFARNDTDLDPRQ